MRMFRKLLLPVVLSLVAVGVAVPVAAQERAAELAVGYNYLRASSEEIDLFAGGAESFPVGWFADIAFNLNRMLGIVGQVNGNYKDDVFDFPGTSARLHQFMGGARVSARPNSMVAPFGQFLVGATNSKFEQDGDSDSSNDFTWQVGGGINLYFGAPVGVRVGADYQRVSEEGPDDTNVFRFTVGVVFGLGGTR